MGRGHYATMIVVCLSVPRLTLKLGMEGHKIGRKGAHNMDACEVKRSLGCDRKVSHSFGISRTSNLVHR